jgi:hypothetical protein
MGYLLSQLGTRRLITPDGSSRNASSTPPWTRAYVIGGGDGIRRVAHIAERHRAAALKLIERNGRGRSP